MFGLFSKEFRRRYGLPPLRMTSTWFMLDNLGLLVQSYLHQQHWNALPINIKSLHYYVVHYKNSLLIARCTYICTWGPFPVILITHLAANIHFFFCYMSPLPLSLPIRPFPRKFWPNILTSTDEVQQVRKTENIIGHAEA